jgi:hypothetical protein
MNSTDAEQLKEVFDRIPSDRSNEYTRDLPEYYLLAPDTGETQSVSGEFAPLVQEGNRFLQATGKTDEFWAAIPDRAKDQTQVGRYNLKTFSFTSALTIPHISFDSMSMWVDEKRGKIYIAYKGQLLSIPLPATDERR